MLKSKTIVSNRLRPDIAAYLSDNPDGILERVAEKFSASTLDVVGALPPENCAIVSGDRFEQIMGDFTTWGEVLMIVHTPNIVLECSGVIPAGSFGRGYFNIHGESPIGGHIKAERCVAIAFVSRPFMGRHSCSVQFFDCDGEAMFKVFVRRDHEKQLLADQVTKFEGLRLELSEAR